MKSIVRYCSDTDYMTLFHLSSLLTELNYERAQLVGSNKYFFSQLLPPNKANQAEEDAGSDSTFFEYDSFDAKAPAKKNASSGSSCFAFPALVQKPATKPTASDRRCFIVNQFDQSKLDLYIFTRMIRSKTDEPAKKYDAAAFCQHLKELLTNDDRFSVEEKLELLKNLCKALLHYVVQRNQPHDRQCSFEMLFKIIDEFRVVNLDFVFYLVTDLNMSVYFFDYLFALNATEIELVIGKYLELFNRIHQNTAEVPRPEQHMECIYSNSQIVQLNVTFSICLIRLMFECRDRRENVVAHGTNLVKLIESLKKASTTNDVPVGFMVFDILRLYNFVLEQFLSGVVEVAAKQTGLLSRNIPINQLKSIFVRPLNVLKDEHLLDVFNDCSKTVASLIDVNRFEGRCSTLSKTERDFVRLVQRNNQELASIWKCVKKFFSNCDVIGNEENDRRSEAAPRGYLLDYVENERAGYLFLVYAAVQGMDYRKIQQLVTQVDLDLLVHPKICYIFAHMAYLKQEQTVFYAEVLKKLVVKIREPNVLCTYVNLHFKQFGFKQLEAIDLHRKREFFNKADAKCASKLREELIKSALLDPLQTMYHLINIPLLSNRNLLVHICNLLCKEFYSLCTFKLTVDVYEMRFLTSLIHNKMQSLDYAELEYLSYFVKYLAFIASSSNLPDLVEIENLILISLLHDNLADVDLLKKKVYFLHTLFDLNDIFKGKLKRVHEKRTPFIIYMVQCLDRFWMDVRSKAYTLAILRRLIAMFNGPFNEKQEAWVKSKLDKLENKLVGFYIAELFEDELIGSIRPDRLTDLLFLCTINEKYYFGKELESHKVDGRLKSKTVHVCLKFIRGHLEVFTPNEHVNLFNFLVEFISLSDLMAEYVSSSIRTRSTNGIEAINQIVKCTFYKRSKLHEYLKADESYSKQFQKFYENINEAQDAIFEFYDEAKFSNFLIELKKFVATFSTD